MTNNSYTTIRNCSMRLQLSNLELVTGKGLKGVDHVSI